jgi:predicted nucleic acid-binding protein
MTAPLFADTNLLVYARDLRDATKQQRATEWVKFLWETRRGRLSRQVLHEYYVTVTRKLQPGLAAPEARADVRALFHWVAPIDPAVLIEAAWVLQDRCSLSFWDALVVGAAQTLGCQAILSEDLPAGQELDGVLVVNPFATGPADFDP